MGSLKSDTGIIKTEMGNLKISSVGCLKSENSCTKQEPTSPDGSSICDLKKNSSSSDFDGHSLTPTSLNSLTPVGSLNCLINPSNLSIPALKFEENGDVEIHSPDYSLWESIFSDQLDGEFMICSPVRNMPSPQASNYNYNYNYAQAMQGQSLVGSSPPRFSSPLGPHKGKGLSPLHRVFNSPNNQFMQVDQVESISMPALESLLDDAYDHKDDDLAVLSPMKIPGEAEGATDCYDALTTVPELLDCFTMPNNSTRFCGSVVSDQNSSQVTQESGIYQVGSVAPQPLSQQLQHERQREEQQEQLQRHQLEPPRIQRQPPQPHHQQNQLQNMHNTLMVPILEPEQVIN